MNKVEIDNLLTAIYDKYENAPYLHMWDTSRKIRNDEEKLKFFENNLDAEIFYFYRKDKNNSNIKEFLSDFIDSFGYHAYDESDIVNKTFGEQILKVIRTYRDVLDDLAEVTASVICLDDEDK